MNEPATTPVAKNWDTYWRGSADRTAYSSDGFSHPAIQAFWQRVFEGVRCDRGAPRIVDVASGNGAVVERALAAFEGAAPELLALDLSAAAVVALVRRFPGVHGIVADARSIPLRSSQSDIVTSQFGIEYAGREALTEVARLVAPGGALALLLHTREGGIYKECAASLEAVQALRRSEFIERALRMFEAGFAARGGADQAPYRAAVKRLQAAFRDLESIMQLHGPQVAGNAVRRLYNDVARMQRDLPRVEPKTVLDWLGSMDAEFQAYGGRMASMCASAIDRQVFDGICRELQGRGYQLRCAEALTLPGQAPLAWALIAQCASG